MKLWTLRQEWNEKEHNREFNSLIKKQIEGSIDYDVMVVCISLLPQFKDNETTYIEHLTDLANYKEFCQKSKEIMRRMPGGRYEVTYRQDGSNETFFNDKVRNYLYATLTTDEVLL